MSETIHDMKAFMAMKDSILDLICFAATTNEQLKPAQELIGRIHRRELYRYIGTTSSLCGGAGEGISGKSEEDILQEILAISMRKREEEEYSFNLGEARRKWRGDYYLGPSTKHLLFFPHFSIL